MTTYPMTQSQQNQQRRYAITSQQNQQRRYAITSQPASEPISIIEARKQIEIGSTDDTHDTQLFHLIVAAREQWEHDTDVACLTQTRAIKLLDWPCHYDTLELPGRPIQSVTSITYYDSGDTSTTLSTDIYSLDAQCRTIRRKRNQTWPAVATDRWDAITVTYVAGHESIAEVPAIWKQAMLLLIGYYFDANRGDNDRANDQAAYERLVMKCMRSSYP